MILKKSSLFIHFNFIVLLISLTYQAKPLTDNDFFRLINPDQSPTLNLQNLLENCTVSHENNLANIVASTQKQWLRPSGSERWMIEDKYHDQRSTMLPLLETLGCIEEEKPTQNVYDYLIILGEEAETFLKRLHTATFWWQQGIHASTIVLLGGNHTLLNPQSVDLLKASAQTETNLPTTEIGMMEYLFYHTDIPHDMKKTKVITVKSIERFDEKRSSRRPTTPETVMDFLALNPTPGSCLVVSNQPYIGYQHETLITFLPPSFNVESIGAALEKKSCNISVCLDALARWLYQRNKRNKMILTQEK